MVCSIWSATSPEHRALTQRLRQFRGACSNARLRASPVRADFNGDNREDYARIAADGSLHSVLNASPGERWMTVRIQGVKNLKNGAGRDGRNEVRRCTTTSRFTRRAACFALDGHADADTIRITWPNGLIQNETHQKAGEALMIAEAQRLSGSCPMIFTWNGKDSSSSRMFWAWRRFGASSGDGNYFPVDHDEYIQIPGSALQPRIGRVSRSTSPKNCTKFRTSIRYG